MSEAPGISRRRFLGALGFLALPLLLGPLRPWRRLANLNASSSLHARLAGLLRNRPSAEVIGREYLRIAPEERSLDVLVDAIRSSLPGGSEGLNGASDSALRELLAARTRQDFEEGITVNLQGWIASVTEARLCAVRALV